MSSNKRLILIHKHKRIIAGSVVSFVAISLLWAWLIYITQPASPHNSYQCNEYIEAVEVFFAYHRGTDKVLVCTNNGSYLLDTGWRNQQKTISLANQLQSITKNVKITIWEHVPKHISNPTTSLFWEKQVVDIRTDTTVYWSISAHNTYQHRERISAIILGSGLTIIVLVVLSVIWWLKMH